MASNLRRLRRDFVVPVAVEPKRFKRIDDPEFALEVAAFREKNNLPAVRSGLPAVGSKLVNRYGLEFVVESHVHVPTANSVQRWREGSQSDADLFPSIIPQNLSERLTSFVAAVDRCTTKTLLVLDTMPHARRDAGAPHGHWVDTIGNGGANLLFIDAAQIHETHFAHEIGHLWVQYVDQAEDERVMEDVSDAGRLHQLSFVQSFVTDLRVNEIIAEKGFDVSVIVEDQAASIASLGRAIEAGYRPENPREGVFMALALAAQILEERRSGSSALAKLEDTLEKATRLDPALAHLATGFADAVSRHGYEGKDQIRDSIDECLKLAFDYSGDGIDLERDLIAPPMPEPDFDKYPRWIEGASSQMKCEVGRIMAHEDIPDGSRWSISPGPLNACHLTFELPDGTIIGPWTLEHSQAFATRIDHIQRINELNRQNRERQMKQQSPNGMPNFPGQPRRFYMAGTARFLTRVREAEWLGGEHPYAYALNNPVTYTDPTGNKPQKFFQSPQWFNWTPWFNPAEDDSLCRGRKPRPTTEWDDNFFWACAICLTRNHIDRDASGGNSDKENHFIAGCLARIRCGDWCPNNVGSYKEASDAIFGGTVSQADALATDDGWDYADSYLNQLGGPFLLDDVKFCEHGARKSVWGTTKGKPKKR